MGLQNKAGQSYFELMDAGDTKCLPVFAARLNPELGLRYNDIDLQHKLAEDHWYVSGYHLSMTHPLTEETMPLFHDAPADGTMFRVVVKSNLTRYLAKDLVENFKASLQALDE